VEEEEGKWREKERMRLMVARNRRDELEPWLELVEREETKERRLKSQRLLTQPTRFLSFFS